MEPKELRQTDEGESVHVNQAVAAGEINRGFWRRLCRYMLIVLTSAVASLAAYAAVDYISWRQTVIQWDFDTIERLCGGDTEEERLLDVRFVREWEYEALKKTPDGDPVWIHWKLSRRHCGNWMLVDQNQRSL